MILVRRSYAVKLGIIKFYCSVMLCIKQEPEQFNNETSGKQRWGITKGKGSPGAGVPLAGITSRQRREVGTPALRLQTL